MSEVHVADKLDKRNPAYTLARGFQAGLLGGVVAAILNLVVYFIALALLQDQLVVPSFPDGGLAPLSPVNVAALSFFPGLGAGLLLWLLNRSTREPLQIMMGISASVLFFSFAAPLGMASIPALTRIPLAAMHVIAAVTVIGILLRYWRR